MAKVKKLSFEEALTELKNRSDKIKSKNLTLDQSIACYEEGIKYYELCKEILDETVQKIEFYGKEDTDEGEL